MNIPTFDLHCDTAYALLGKDYRRCGSLRSNNGHIDLNRATTLDAYAQCFACFTSEQPEGIAPTELFERELATIHRELERNGDIIRQAYTFEDVLKNKEDGLASAILTIEGPAAFGFDPELLHDLWLVGFRMSTLCWNEPNVLTGSCLSGGGLTDLGRSYVNKAQQLGIMVDLSHISDTGFWDVVKITNAPLVVSHSNSRAVCNVSRNITDDMFLAVCDSGGIVGINLYADFIGNGATLDRVCDHIIHFLEKDPSGKHVALGGDLDGCDKLPKDFCGVQDYPKLAARLLERGVSKENIYDLYWNNAVEVMRLCCT